LSADGRGLDDARLRILLSEVPFATRVEIRGSTGSTSDEVRRLARQGAPSGTVVLADAQSAGRGRLGRRWHSAPGLGLYVSVLIRPSRPVETPTRWTLAAALAAWEACGALGYDGVSIEWPNDLYHGGRKLAGTLTELRSIGSAVQEVIVGTGINVGHAEEDFPEDLAERATSLALVRPDQPADREGLAAAYVERLGALVARLEAGGWPEVVSAWTRRAPNASGAHVSVRLAGDAASFQGVTRGVDDSGALRVERPDGSVMTLRSTASIKPAEG
jgi:BirA family biotin operon repressor/biotin-[acetyl-CoA-carboxylase] ligase